MVTAIGSAGSDGFAGRVRQGGLTVTVTGRAVSPYRYLVAFQRRGAIPSGLSLQATTASLAAVPTSYHGPVDGWRNAFPAVSFDGRSFGTIFTVPVPAPLSRTGYYTPGGWSVSVEDGVILTSERQHLALHPGANGPLCWDGAVIGPGLTGENELSTVPFASRHDDALTAQLPLFSDAAGTPDRRTTGSATNPPAAPRCTGTTSSSARWRSPAGPSSRCRPTRPTTG